MRTMKLKYFAWVRERIGTPEEEVDLPPGVATGADLIAWLAGRGEGYAHAFERPEVIRVAADQLHVPHEAVVREAREIALFPPMTGG